MDRGPGSREYPCLYPSSTMAIKPRILLYSHDTYGLGHLRRSLAVAHQLAQDIPDLHQLLITGSMVAGAFSLPPRLDMVKLPALSKRSSGQYKARSLPLTLRQTLRWREQMILQAALNFRPHLVLVDKVPGGVHGEMLPTLRYLRTWSPETRIVLGMRDIEDSPEATRAEWHANGTHQLLEQVYDAILLYGERRLFDPVAAYGMTPRAAQKLRECGYLRRNTQPRPPDMVRRELDVTDRPLVVVTVGGGGDGYPILRTHLQMVEEHRPDFHSLVVTGPLMPRGKRALLQRMAQGQDVTLLEFTPDLPSYIHAADLVVSMAGYNTVCELLSLGQRALLIPRVRVRAEQRIRATQMAQQGLAQVLLPSELTPARLLQAIQQGLAAPPPRISLALDGLERVSQAIQELLERPERPHPRSLHNPHGRLSTVAIHKELFP